VWRGGVCSTEPGAGTGQLESGCRGPLEGAKPARRGLHLLSPLFGSDTAPAPVASLRLIVIRRARDSPSRCASSVIPEHWPGACATRSNCLSSLVVRIRRRRRSLSPADPANASQRRVPTRERYRRETLKRNRTSSQPCRRQTVKRQLTPRRPQPCPRDNTETSRTRRASARSRRPMSPFRQTATRARAPLAQIAVCCLQGQRPGLSTDFGWRPLLSWQEHNA
jgi:hypothetical protein